MSSRALFSVALLGAILAPSCFEVGRAEGAPSPHITAISPKSGTQAGGTLVTITGSNLGAVTTVTFGGAPATITYRSSTKLRCTTPTGLKKGTVDVKVTAPAGSWTRYSAYTYSDAIPSLSTVSPSSAPEGAPVPVTLYGKGFFKVGTLLPTVRVGSLAATSVTLVSSSTIKCVFPDDAAGSKDVIVTNPDGRYARRTGAFQRTPQPLSVTGISPGFGPVGTAVTITGTGFTGTTAVTFNGVNASSFIVNGPTRITAVVGPGSKDGPVRVTAPGGTASYSLFIVLQPPTITAFTPTEGRVGTIVTINGTNLGTTTGVTFNGVVARYVQLKNATEISAAVSAGTTTGPITVTTAAGHATSAASFRLRAPAVTSFTPVQGAAGTAVTITGVDLDGATGVTFNGCPQPVFTVVSPTTITTTVPTQATTGAVGVAMPDGPAVSGPVFTVAPRPSIESFTPGLGGAGTSVTIKGANLDGATEVAFGGVAAQSFTVVSASELHAIVGAGATGVVSVRTPGGFATSGGTFAGAPASFTGAGARGLATADLNGDGLVDVVTPNGIDDTVTVLLGAGGGAFQRAVPYPSGAATRAVAIGDLDRDGRPDVVVANAAGVAVLAGVGTGTLQPAVQYACGSGAGITSVAIGDLNGDGAPDVAVVSFADSAAYVLLNDGLGGLKAAATYAVGQSPRWTGLGDMNRDGKLDLVSVNTGDDSVSLLLGDGAGHFAAPTLILGGTYLMSGALADVNGDGILDVAVSSLGSVMVALGKGDGHLKSLWTLKVSAPGPAALGDLDGDGRVDLAFGGASSVSVLAGMGDGTFGAAIGYPAASVDGLAIADASGDGRPDLLACGASMLTPLVALQGGGFQTGIRFATGAGPSFVAAADLNGDKKVDLVVADSGANDVAVLVATGGGAFAKTAHYATNAQPVFVAVGDVDGDKKADLVVADASGVSRLPGVGDGTFLPLSPIYPGAGCRSVAIGDLNGDGLPDLVVTLASGAKTVLVFLGAGGGSFRPPVSYAAGAQSVSIALADVNGDGALDVLVANRGDANPKVDPGSVSVLLGEGDGTLDAARSFGAGTSPLSIAVGDLDGDGALDLVVGASDAVSVLSGRGDGTFSTARAYGRVAARCSVAVADLQGDGRLDVVAAETGQVAVLLGDGAGGLQPEKLQTGFDPISVAVADLDGDGLLDVAIANASTGDVSVLLGTTAGQFVHH